MKGLEWGTSPPAHAAQQTHQNSDTSDIAGSLKHVGRCVSLSQLQMQDKIVVLTAPLDPVHGLSA